MRALVLACGLVGAAFLSGCSSAYHVDLAEVGKHRLAHADGPDRVPRGERPKPRTATAVAAAADAEVTGTIGRNNSAEAARAQNAAALDNDAQERRVRDAISNICRGC